jgi:hypothetical protein
MQKLTTKIWVSALLKRVEIGGSFSAILKKGDADAGVCLIKVCDHEGNCTLYKQIRNIMGEIAWLPKGPLKECVIDEDLEKRVRQDPDLWVVEIIDKKRYHYLTEPIEK